MIKLMLNKYKFNNYAFFCPISRLHLTVSSPIGYTDKVTPAILKALKSKTLLDVDNVIDVEKGTIKAQEQAVNHKQVNIVDESKQVNDEVVEDNKENKSSKKNNKKSVKTANAE